ncbi:envelope stress response membrane protein PspB [Saccharobesus litoralis]|uniref:Envelope stress response membrane protein PspB n=1 Tax=Saccharobesus litoralis TaxID=2172099 RepID=A0A2S0VSL9_9ALTE|nr:envelope stress response membrane protein PspB [Saccharobesus litoralis]AWB67100.1 envelope stress response membrane protein PspB [Saccharobesus litoralis]
MEITELIFVPTILFMVVVAPIWLVLHYRSKRQIGQGLSETESYELEKLAKDAERMAQRIQSLEQILDQESPQWRRHHE